MKKTEVIAVEDEKIVALYFARSEKAIEETESKYGKYIRAIAQSILQNPSDTEEAVNDTYFDAWNSIPPHRPKILATFLGKITRRIAIDRVRKQNADKRGGGELALVLEELDECLYERSSVEEKLEAEELAKAIDRFLKTLPETERKVFLCRYFYVDSVTSIAQNFSFSVSKVKSMLMRTREKLKQYLIKEVFI